MTDANKGSHRIAVCSKCWHLADGHATDEDPHELGRCLSIGCECAEYEDALKTLDNAADEVALLRSLLKDGFAYVRDANRLMAEDGDLDEEDEDGANEWLEKAAAALTGGAP